MFFKKNNYINKEITAEIEEKWFNVYNYISIDELLLTVRKDYLDYLSFINIPFWIATVGLWLFSYLSSQYLILFIFLFIVYSIIFLLLFIKLLRRTYHFLLISDVVFTKKWIIFWDSLYEYSDTKTLDRKLYYYEKIFLEYLGGKSRLHEYINSKRKELIHMKSGGKFSQWFWKFLRSISESWWGQQESWKIIIVLVASYALYVVFLYLSYYMGYFLGMILMKIYTFFIRILLFFKDNYELKIKKMVTEIDNDIEKMNRVYSLLDSKYTEFSAGEISDISKFTHTNFENFYTEIFSVYENKNKLEKLISEGKYKNFIDFLLFEKYLRKTFNKPISSMITLLENYLKKIPIQLKKLEKLRHDEEGVQGTIESKKIILKNNQDLLQVNIAKLKESLI